MSWRRASAWTYGTLGAALVVASSLGAEWNRRLVMLPRHGQIVFGQSDDEQAEPAEPAASADSPRIWQKIDKLPGVRKASYGFVDFKQDRLTLSYKIPWDPLESTCRHASLSIL